MAGEIHPTGPTGLSCYVHIVDYNAFRWNGTTFEEFNALNYANYDVDVSEDGSTGIYVGDFPEDIEVGVYDVILYRKTGATPANGDVPVGIQNIQWHGSSAPNVEQSGDIDYSDIKTQVQYNLGRRGDPDVLAQLSMWARMALRDIINWRDSWFLHAEATVTTADGTQIYDLPTDHKDNLKIWIQKSDRWVELNGPIDLVEARRRFTPQSTGEPTDWSHYGSHQFKVWPVDPDAAFTLKLDYTRYISDLVNDEDTNTITVYYPQLLIALMTKYGFKYLQEFEDAKEWEGEANRIFGDLHANYVARVLGRDFILGARTDVKGHMDQSRGTANYIVLR